MPTPNDAISAAIAATIHHDQDGSKKDRSLGSITPGLHRKSISGGSAAPVSHIRTTPSIEYIGRTSESPSPIIEEPPSPRSNGAMATAMQQQQQQQRKSRTRKGSLRKSAILGTSKIRNDDRDRRSASNPYEASSSPGYEQRLESNNGIALPARSTNPFAPLDLLTSRPQPTPPPVPMVTHPVHGDPSKILEVTDAKEPFPDLKRPFTAKSSTASTTTDDDESLALPLDFLAKKASSLSLPTDSYFPPQISRLGRVPSSIPKPKSPLATLPPAIPTPAPHEWDYSETRSWGWLILCVTWIVFVVGMGSCFDIWSWAWDVGETPYAPPELEDDPTLPIVGYYPALIVLTCVMAWVWVTIAWVGMKYFRHANISGDEDDST